MREKRYARITPQAVMTDFPLNTVINGATVNGYLYDGDYWYPAYDTWDGWIPFYGDYETYEPLQNSDADLEWMKTI